MINNDKPFVIGYNPEIDKFFITNQNTLLPVLRKKIKSEEAAHKYIYENVELLKLKRNKYVEEHNSYIISRNVIFIDNKDGTLTMLN